MGGIAVAAVWLGLAALTRSMVLPIVSLASHVLVIEGRARHLCAFRTSPLPARRRADADSHRFESLRLEFGVHRCDRARTSCRLTRAVRRGNTRRVLTPIVAAGTMPNMLRAVGAVGAQRGFRAESRSVRRPRRRGAAGLSFARRRRRFDRAPGDRE